MVLLLPSSTRLGSVAGIMMSASRLFSSPKSGAGGGGVVVGKSIKGAATVVVLSLLSLSLLLFKGPEGKVGK